MTRIVISRCLGLDLCRYNGEKIDAPWLQELASKVDILSVCPEAEIGLGVPRSTIYLVKDEKGVRVIQDGTGFDLSEQMVSFSQGYLRYIGNVDAFSNVDAFILKSKSPSCGLGTTKIHEGKSYSLGSGVFAALTEKICPNAVLVDEIFMETNGVDALLDLIKKS